jgi:hypothetical protein
MFINMTHIDSKSGYYVIPDAYLCYLCAHAWSPVRYSRDEQQAFIGGGG